MVIELTQSLEDFGATVAFEPADSTTVLVVNLDGRVTRFAMVERRREPYPNEIAGLASRRDVAASIGCPLLVIPHASEITGAYLVTAGWSWADHEGNFDLRAPGLRVQRRVPAKRARSAGRRLPRGPGSAAIIRALIGLRDGEAQEVGASSLALQAGVSQPRASQVLGALGALGLAHKEGRRWVPEREQLLDAFLSSYSGPGGSAEYFYSLGPLSVLASRVAQGTGCSHDIVVSADVGPDLIVSWRRPEVVVFYARIPLTVGIPGLVRAQGRPDANVILRVPEDRSLFANPALSAELNGVEIALADPSQMVWDLRDLGGADRLEAAGRLRAWLLNR